MDSPGHFFCTVALINSETLCSRFLRIPLHFVLHHNIEQLNIYSIAGLFSDADRQRFIGALKCHRNFETTMTYNGNSVNVGLYHTNSFGSFWSHILTLSSDHDDPAAAPLTQFVSSGDHRCSVFLETLDSMHKYSRLAADSWNTEAPSVIKEYLDKATTLGDRLTELIDTAHNLSGNF